MPTDPRKRQKKLERRAAKRQEKKHHLVRAQAAGLGGRLAAAAKAPVLHCWVAENLWSQGLGPVHLSRALPNGFVAVAVFLVDRYCLGVKNAIADIVSRSTYEAQFVRKTLSQFSLREISPATARKFVETAVDYARDLGFAPHTDYHKAKLLFGDIDASQATEALEFGKDGKPFFFAGPHDTPQRCRQIINTLTRKLGPNGFHFVIPARGDELILPGAVQNEDFLEDGTDFQDEA
jgi:hypothetical protein